MYDITNFKIGPVVKLQGKVRKGLFPKPVQWFLLAREIHRRNTTILAIF